MPVDQQALKAFLEQFAADQAATMHAATVTLGERLGLYEALAEGPATADELAARAGCNARLVAEWLKAQVVSGYAHHGPAAERYWLDPVQVSCLADRESNTFVAGGALVSSSNHCDVDRLVEAFRGDGGVDWEEHHPHLFSGTERFFGPVYRANLVPAWIPALDGVEEKLRRGALVADVGCGHGVSVMLMAEAFPESRFVGIDYDEGSIDAARTAAEAAGVSDRVSFEVATAEDFTGDRYDLVCVFNALHEWGDPTAAARSIARSLAPDGTWMFSEPLTDAGLVPSTRARTFYSVSTFVCTPSALAQGGEDPLGAQAGEQRLARVVAEAGFTRFRRAAETPNFMVMEARL